MTFKAPRRRHDAGRAITPVSYRPRSVHAPADDPSIPASDKLMGRWTVAEDGRLVLTWAVVPERPDEQPARPARRPRPRRRGSLI